MSRLPLEGVRIIDSTYVFALPYAGGLLADMGAEVIKVEGPGRPDVTRTGGFAGSHHRFIIGRIEPARNKNIRQYNSNNNYRTAEAHLPEQDSPSNRRVNPPAITPNQKQLEAPDDCREKNTIIICRKSLENWKMQLPFDTNHKWFIVS